MFFRRERILSRKFSGKTREGDKEMINTFISRIGGVDAVADMLKNPDSVKGKSAEIKKAIRDLIAALGGIEGVVTKVVAALQGTQNELTEIINKFATDDHRNAAKNPFLVGMVEDTVRKIVQKVLKNASS